MHNLTNMLVKSELFHGGVATSKQEVAEGEPRLVDKSPKLTIYIDPDETTAFNLTYVPEQKSSLELPVSMEWLPTGADSIPLQIWEGTVLQINHEAGVMHVLLDAKMGQVPRHSADIDLMWVSDQDEDLVCPGAVFYLTLFKRTKGSGIENSQELRFRRRPSWTPAQLKRIDEDSSELLAKMTALPSAE